MVQYSCVPLFVFAWITVCLCVNPSVAHTTKQWSPKQSADTSPAEPARPPTPAAVYIPPHTPSLQTVQWNTATHSSPVWVGQTSSKYRTVSQLWTWCSDVVWSSISTNNRESNLTSTVALLQIRSFTDRRLLEIKKRALLSWSYGLIVEFPVRYKKKFKFHPEQQTGWRLVKNYYTDLFFSIFFLHHRDCLCIFSCRYYWKKKNNNNNGSD